MPRSEAQKKADKKYADKFFLLRVKLTFDEKKSIDEYIGNSGETVSGFVRRAIKDAINRG